MLTRLQAVPLAGVYWIEKSAGKVALHIDHPATFLQALGQQA